MALAPFHGRSERLVRQELSAHFTLIALTRLCANHSERGFQAAPDGHGRPAILANCKNGLNALARQLEELLLHHASLLARTVQRIVEDISCCRQRRRPGRSVPRISRKPVGKWRNRKSATPATPA